MSLLDKFLSDCMAVRRTSGGTQEDANRHPQQVGRLGVAVSTSGRKIPSGRACHMVSACSLMRQHPSQKKKRLHRGGVGPEMRSLVGLTLSILQVQPASRAKPLSGISLNKNKQVQFA
jgi:hypothetical protein